MQIKLIEIDDSGVLFPDMDTGFILRVSDADWNANTDSVAE